MEWFLEYGQAKLRVVCDRDLRLESTDELVVLYDELVAYINRNPFFKVSYEPVHVGSDAPKIAFRMADAAEVAGVGPMASVAGAFSQSIGEFLVSNGAKDVLVDNGGDIYLNLNNRKIVRIFAGSSVLSGKISLKVSPSDTPCGLCTSSASVGPSVSLGGGDAVTVVCESAILADACATAVANSVLGPEGISHGISEASVLPGLRGVLIVAGDKFGCWGSLPEIGFL